MGFLKDTIGDIDGKPFPGANFEASGTVPEPQCTKAVVEGDHGQIRDLSASITDVGNFTGLNLVGKYFTVLSPVVSQPTQQILSNNDDVVDGSVTMNNWSNDAVYYIHNGGALEETRTAQSIMQFALDNGFAATMKGGKVFTDIPSANLELACRILFAPLT